VPIIGKMEAGPTLPPDTRLGPIRLNAGDQQRLSDFYERVIGLRSVEPRDGIAALGAEPGHAIVELVPTPDAPPRPGGTSGLFHLAILVPHRADLAHALRRVSESGWRFTGASDHLVSEALYLRDPEGNGIEIYRDRPRSEWRRTNGELELDTRPLDLDSVLGEARSAETTAASMPSGTQLGHVHLNVSELSPSESFYAAGLGLDVTVRGYPGALFLSAGGYHHHLGLNTWMGEGVPPPPPGALGLNRYEVIVPSADAVDQVERRFAQGGVETARSEEGLLATDPSRNRLIVTSRP